MTICPFMPEELLPHAPPMVLLDAVAAWDDVSLTAMLTIRPGILFFEAGRGVPAHVAMEWMAQACGAFAGLNAKAAGQPVRLGFLLGTRRFTASPAWFADGEVLSVRIQQVFLENGMAVFDCCVQSGDTERANAQLTVYQPEDASAVFSSRTTR